MSTNNNTASTISTTYGVTGMTCGHCVAAVTEEVAAVAGAQTVTVDLVVGGVSQVTVTSEAVLDRGLVAAAVDEAGYELAPAAE
jgi:copper chaperone CopZ